MSQCRLPKGLPKQYVAAAAGVKPPKLEQQRNGSSPSASSGPLPWLGITAACS